MAMPDDVAAEVSQRISALLLASQAFTGHTGATVQGGRFPCPSWGGGEGEEGFSCI